MLLFWFTFGVLVTSFIVAISWPKEPPPIPQGFEFSVEDELKEQLHQAKMENVELLRKLSGSVYK